MIKIQNIFPQLSEKHLELARQGLKSLLARQDLGFTQLLSRTQLWQSSAHRAEQLKSQGVTRVGVLGMGGSSLGARSLWESYGCQLGALEDFLYFDNLDSTAFFQRFEKLANPTSIHFLVVSKSGTTLETLAMADYLDQFLKDRGSCLAQQATVISELRSTPLSDWARNNKVPLLEIPKDVAGRFSVLTPVGLLPAALMGYSFDEIRQGVEWVDQSATPIVENLIGASLASLERRDQVLYFWSYAEGLQSFGAWFQQLWAESLGKSKTIGGEQAPPVPVPSLGSMGQHSTLQQVIEGGQPHWVWVVQNTQPSISGPILKQSQFAGGDIWAGRKLEHLVAVQAQATEQALVQHKIPTVSLSVAGLSPRTIGALFYLAELTVGGLGEVMGINVCDQPGVELGKRLAKELLSKKGH